MTAIMIMIGVIAWMPVGVVFYTVRRLDKWQAKK